TRSTSSPRNSGKGSSCPSSRSRRERRSWAKHTAWAPPRQPTRRRTATRREVLPDPDTRTRKGRPKAPVCGRGWSLRKPPSVAARGDRREHRAAERLLLRQRVREARQARDAFPHEVAPQPYAPSSSLPEPEATADFRGHFGSSGSTVARPPKAAELVVRRQE